MAFLIISSTALDLPRSTADLPTVVSDRLGRVFNRSGATSAVLFDTFKAFDRVWHTGLLHKRMPYGI